MATHNVYGRLGPAAARRCLGALLEEDPDLVALQEWGPRRVRLLGETGGVRLLPGLRLLNRAGPYTWISPLVGGCVVGARSERFELVTARQRVLSSPGRAERPDYWGFEEPRIATVTRWRDRETGHVVTLISYHLAAGVQAHDRYRPERPRLVARHRQEAARLTELVEERLAAGDATYAAGDSNLHGFELPGLASAWAGRADVAGTHGPRRRIDDIFAPQPADEVALLETESDHRAVIARWRGGR